MTIAPRPALLRGAAMLGLILSGSAAQAASFSVLHAFAPGEGGLPMAPVTYYGGALWGTTESYGPGTGNSSVDGTVFALPLAGGTPLVIPFHGPGFSGDTNDSHAFRPLGGLTPLGNYLYGTSALGGIYGAGAVFRIQTSNHKVLVHSFQGPDGAVPTSNLLAFQDALYGTTIEGGASGEGAVFSILSNGKERVVYGFDPSGSVDDGLQPAGPLIHVGYAYANFGLTSSGGSHNCGALYSVTKSGQEHVVYSFAGGSDGCTPVGGLVYLNHVFYGVTSAGGTNNLGTIFSVAENGPTDSVLHNFAGGSDGATPQAGLVLLNGVFYGTTYAGGANAQGTVFSITPTAAETVLHAFDGANDGGHSVAPLIAVGTTLYGTASTGGTNGIGTVFSITP